MNHIGITTNGILLKRFAEPLVHAGMTHLNVSLDTLIPVKFEFITRRKGWQRVMEGLDLALKLGLDPVKVN